MKSLFFILSDSTPIKPPIKQQSLLPCFFAVARGTSATSVGAGGGGCRRGEAKPGEAGLGGRCHVPVGPVLVFCRRDRAWELKGEKVGVVAQAALEVYVMREGGEDG